MQSNTICHMFVVETKQNQTNFNHEYLALHNDTSITMLPWYGMFFGNSWAGGL